MNKYRIVEVIDGNLNVTFRIQKRYLWVFWEDLKKLVSFSTYAYIEFYTYKEAEDFIEKRLEEETWKRRSNAILSKKKVGQKKKIKTSIK